MADTDALWLEAAKALKLDDDLAALRTLASTVAAWGRISADLQTIDSVGTLLDRLAAGLDAEAIANAFNTLDLAPVLAGLKALVPRIKDAEGRIPETYKTLLKPLSGFTPDAAPGVVRWSLATSDQPVVKTERYALDLGASAVLTLTAAARWPGEAATNLVKIGAEGQAKAGAKATAPYAFGTLQAAAGGSSSLNLDYYFAAPRDKVYAAALATGLSALADPFDFDSVWAAFASDAGLEGIIYAFGGAANASLQVGFADAVALSAGIVPKFDLTVGVSASLDSHYKLALRRTSTQAGAPAIHAVLSRAKVSEAGFNAALKLEVDVAALTRPVIETLQRAVGDWDVALAEIKPYLSPGTWLRDKAAAALTQEIKTLVSNADLSAALQTDLKGALGLGKVETSALESWLSGQITGAIDRGSVLVSGPIDKAVDGVLAQLEAALPFLAQSGQTAALKAAIGTLVKRADDTLQAEARKLVPGAGLQAALAKANGAAVGAVNSADDALKAVRDLLGRYDKTVHKVLAQAEAAAKQKVTARLYSRETLTSGSSVEIDGTFLAASETNSRLFEALTRGTLQGLVRLIDGQDAAPDFHLDAKASSVTRFSRYGGEDGLEIAFLGVNLKAAELVSAEAAVMLDGQGDIHVDTAANLKKTLSTPMSDREVSFVDVHALVLAAGMKQTPDTPSLKIGIGAVYSDKTLKWGDIDDFIDGLAVAGLVSPAATASAKTAFDRWSIAAGGEIAGDMAASLQLNGPAIETLLQLSERTNGKLNDSAKRRIILAGLEALLTCGAIRKKVLQDALNAATSLFLGPTPKTADEVILRYRTKIPPINLLPPNVVPRSDNKPDIQLWTEEGRANFMTFLWEAFKLERLIDLIEVMGEVYLAKPAGGAGVIGGWSPAEYLQRQKAMAYDSRYLLTTFSNVLALFNSDITPRTLAFMRAMAALGGTQQGARLALTYRPTSGPPQTISFG